jgi:excisionase family DNA binding protein
VSVTEHIRRASSAQHRTPLLTPEQVAAVLGVSVRTVRRLAAEGRLRPVRIGYRTTRFRPEDVDALIAPTQSKTPEGIEGLAERTADAGRRLLST